MSGLSFKIQGHNEELSFLPTRLINAGYTGRDQAAVKEHVEELKKMGVIAPDKTPCFFPKGPDRIQRDGVIYPLDINCSGEVEFVLLVAEDGWYITVGCDIFDYKVEGFQADKSKLLYPNYLAKEVWKYEEVKDHWDELVIRSWIGPDHATLYQESKLEKVMHIEDMVKEMEAHLKDGAVTGTVLSGGSVACFVDGMPCMECMEFEIYDPVLDRRIESHYDAERIDWYID